MSANDKLREIYEGLSFERQMIFDELSVEQKKGFAEIVVQMTALDALEEKQEALFSTEMNEEQRTLLEELIRQEHIKHFSNEKQRDIFETLSAAQKKQVREILSELTTLNLEETQEKLSQIDDINAEQQGVLEEICEREHVKRFFEEDLVLNGINIEGKYAMDPVSPEALAESIQGNAGKPMEEISAERYALETQQPKLKDLSRKQWERLLNNINEARRALLLSLDENQAQLLVKLFNRPWDFKTLTETVTKTFRDSESSRFVQLIDEQQAMFDTLTQEYSDTLYAGLDAEQQSMLEAMIAEQHALFEELEGKDELDEKHSFAISFASPLSSFPTTLDVKDPADVSQSGWGIIFPTAMAKEKRECIKSALKELLELREAQAGPLFRVYEGPGGYRPGDTKSKFLQRHGVGSGLANPREMPFYILLIGSPEEIPYDFEDQLDVMRGVGRLNFTYFEDNVWHDDYQAYAQYAHNVVMAETGQVKLPKKATFFAVANDHDKATQLSAKYLIRPLRKNLADTAANLGEELDYGWDWQFVGNGEATHDRLKQLLGGDPSQSPALLLSASHGMEFPYGHDNQFKHQGALLCQDWPGPKGTLDRKHYFAGEDLTPDANMLGMIAVLFACYGAGTPRFDQFSMQGGQREIAPRPFVAALPQQLLKHGALAVLGHVERAWGYSFIKPNGDIDNAHFVVALRRLLNGKPIGLATDPGFDLRYADMSSELNTIMEELKAGKQILSDTELAQLWTANNDARGYAVIGDPAARIPFAKDDETPVDRPPLETPEITPFVAEEEKSPSSTEPELLKASAAIEYGIRDEFDKLKISLGEFTDQLAKSLEKAATDIATLEVKTYTTDDLSAVTAQSEGQARLRALTHIAFDGDMKVFVPQDREGEVDRVLWNVHLEMVREAQANRAQFLQAMAEMATNLLKSLK